MGGPTQSDENQTEFDFVPNRFDVSVPATMYKGVLTGLFVLSAMLIVILLGGCTTTQSVQPSIPNKESGTPKKAQPSTSEESASCKLLFWC